MATRPWIATRERRQATANASRPCAGYCPIADYAVIGNAQSAALVSSEGAIDWLCLPHFDSPAVLCRILDADKGGYLSLTPARSVRGSRRRYRDASNVLETELETDAGRLTLTDAMPLAADNSLPALGPRWEGHGRHWVIRQMRATGGAIEVALRARVAFDFAQTPADVELIPGEGALVSARGEGERHLALVWPGELAQDERGELRGTLRLAGGEEATCVLAYNDDAATARGLLAGQDWAALVREADAGWRRWCGRCHLDGPYREALLRSVLALKLLTFAPTGATLAAPTTSLPERLGGARNWDYRYCWLRDATLTLYALVLAGDDTTARAFTRWIERTCADHPVPELKIMYTIHGTHVPDERELPNLAGYCDSRPVRVGNAAACQRQLDVYGEVLDAFWFAFEHLHHGADADYVIDERLWRLFRGIADYICDVWREPDCGIWEMRGPTRQFVYSKTMCWVGLDRAIRFAEHTDHDGDITRWKRERAAIRADILARGYNERVGAFTMAYGSDVLDAATLRMLLVGFLPASDPRMRSTVKKVQEGLTVDGLVRRYQTASANDGLVGGEGTFAACTFWLVDCLTALGEIQEARSLFERMLGYANDVGLYAEEIDPVHNILLGNYPQAFTHLALVSAGLDLTEALASNVAMPAEASARAHAIRRGREARGAGLGRM